MAKHVTLHEPKTPAVVVPTHAAEACQTIDIVRVERNVTDDEVRTAAYLHWEAAGRPDGDGVEFWLAAERELRGGDL